MDVEDTGASRAGLVRFRAAEGVPADEVIVLIATPAGTAASPARSKQTQAARTAESGRASEPPKTGTGDVDAVGVLRFGRWSGSGPSQGANPMQVTDHGRTIRVASPTRWPGQSPPRRHLWPATAHPRSHAHTGTVRESPPGTRPAHRPQRSTPPHRGLPTPLKSVKPRLHCPASHRRTFDEIFHPLATAPRRTGNLHRKPKWPHPRTGPMSSKEVSVGSARTSGQVANARIGTSPGSAREAKSRARFTPVRHFSPGIETAYSKWKQSGPRECFT